MTVNNICLNNKAGQFSTSGGLNFFFTFETQIFYKEVFIGFLVFFYVWLIASTNLSEFLTFLAVFNFFIDSASEQLINSPQRDNYDVISQLCSNNNSFCKAKKVKCSNRRIIWTWKIYVHTTHICNRNTTNEAYFTDEIIQTVDQY